MLTVLGTRPSDCLVRSSRQRLTRLVSVRVTFKADSLELVVTSAPPPGGSFKLQHSFGISGLPFSVRTAVWYAA